MKNALMILVAALATFGLSTNASASWQPILTISLPYTGTAPTFAQIHSNTIKIEKVGAACANSWATWKPIVTDDNGSRWYVQTSEQPQTAGGARIYTTYLNGQEQVLALSHIEFTTTNYSGDCTYKFSVKVSDDNLN